jgi:O-antigen/teichoic acid export membrane protein
VRDTLGQDRLRSPSVGLHVVRGGAMRVAGYALGIAVAAGTSVFLLRHLGVAGFGRYMTVASLVAIVTGITELGLNSTASRELALLAPESSERNRILRNILGVRLLITPLAVLGATLFAVLAHYDRAMVLGTLLAGAGAVLVAGQSTMTLPLATDLHLAAVVAIDLVKQVVLFIGVASLALTGASLLPFFGVQVAVGLVALLVTPFFVRSPVWLPGFDPAVWKTLLLQTLPLAVSVALAIVYLRVLIIVMSLISNPVQTGYFATSFRVLETFFGAAALAASVVLPALAVAARDSGRVRYMFQRMIEVATMIACLLVLLVVILAEPVLELLGGPAYRPAASVLRVQAIALLPIFIGQMCQFTLIAMRRQSAQAIANAVALVLLLVFGLVLIPLDGARGAAIAAVAGEASLTALLLFALSRRNSKLVPNFIFLWKVGLALAVGGLALFVHDGSAWLRAAAAGIAYLAILLLVKAVPPEVLDAIPRGTGLRRRVAR